MKILVLTPYLPHRRVGHGGGTAVRDLITWLAKKHDVMVLSLVRPDEAGLLDEVTELGARVQGLPFLDNAAQGASRLDFFRRRIVAFTRSLSSGYPLYVEKYADDHLSQLISTAVEDFQPDAIQVEYLQMSTYCRQLRQNRDADGRATPRLILNSHELGSLPRERRAQRAGNPFSSWLARREATAWRKLQVDASSWADTTLCVTPEDHELYAAMGGHNLVTMPLGMDLSALQADWQPGTVDGRETHLFVGSFGHRPNVLAAEMLINRIWPQVITERPAAQLVLAGRGSQEFLASQIPATQWSGRRVEALGFVDDLTPHFRNCRLFVAPLAEGGGIKIKILEAMARGVPVVTTPVGAEGIAQAADNILTISACDESFAAAVLRDADDLQGCQQRATAARQRMEDHFSWEAITDRLGNLYGNFPQ